MAKLKTAVNFSNKEFAAKYTRNQEGFYVRNQQPASKTVTQKRIADAMRELLKVTPEKAAKAIESE